MDGGTVPPRAVARAAVPTAGCRAAVVSGVAAGAALDSAVVAGLGSAPRTPVCGAGNEATAVVVSAAAPLRVGVGSRLSSAFHRRIPAAHSTSTPAMIAAHIAPLLLLRASDFCCSVGPSDAGGVAS